jgi:hypothetical protein
MLTLVDRLLTSVVHMDHGIKLQHMNQVLFSQQEILINIVFLEMFHLVLVILQLIYLVVLFLQLVVQIF